MKKVVIALSMFLFVAAAVLLYVGTIANHNPRNMVDHPIEQAKKAETVAAPSSDQPEVAGLKKRLQEVARQRNSSFVEIEKLKKRVAELTDQLKKRGSLSAPLMEKPTPKIVSEPKTQPRPGQLKPVFTLNGSIWQGGDPGKLKAEVRTRLETLIKKIPTDPELKIMVAGHSDSMPLSPRNIRKYGDNLGLSVFRAAHVARVMAENGIEAQRISVIGYGDAYPIADNDTPSGRAKNRRVEIIYLK